MSVRQIALVDDAVHRAYAPPDVMPSASDPGPSAAALIPWLHAYQARVHAVLQYLIAQQCHAWGRCPAASAASAQWPVLRAALLPTPVSLGALVPQASRLALLEPEWLVRALAARALFASRAALRLVVARAQRQALSLVLGEPALTTLMQLSARALPGRARPLPDVCTPLALARLGWRWIQHDQACPVAMAEALITSTLQALGADPGAGLDLAFGFDLDLDFDLGVGISISMNPGTGHADVAPPGAESACFLAMVPLLFPELQWLFG
ncbi:type III secretion protein HrpB4 [Paraburkholderia hayleyella]|uniref:type III secretion protein HrpB4 n=1 Tax=Paraburkholderia hayleyella TaxID=2152889 RepID=UPI0015808084|nr:type III secretion protein HrpB4 [Paraburkholderia hayleyella]